MTPEEKKLWAEERLREKQKELGRLPKNEDFDGATKSRIKAFLGPWPRALEAAGLKAPRPEDADAGNGTGSERYPADGEAQIVKKEGTSKQEDAH